MLPVSYHTLSTDDGARHAQDPNLNDPLRLGFFEIDVESDGSPSNADGDDTDNLDDEDGVQFSQMIRNQITDVDVAIFGNYLPAFLSVWIDFNADGDWDDMHENIFLNEPIIPGQNYLYLGFLVPPNAVIGPTYTRFRLSSDSNFISTYTGPAPDGEVEDYLVDIH